jgi:membrane protease YdiL (CAAX protease family)
LILLALTGDFFPTSELFPFFDRLVSGAVIVPLNVDLFSWVLAFLLLVVLQPIAEELVFRGVVYPALRANFGAWLGFGMVVVLYALFHLVAYAPQPPNLWYGFFMPLLVGAVITFTRAYTGSTRAAIIAHAAFGLFALLKAFAISG